MLLNAGSCLELGRRYCISLGLWMMSVLPVAGPFRTKRKFLFRSGRHRVTWGEPNHSEAQRLAVQLVILHPLRI